SNSPVKSDTFTGYCSISGVFYSGTKFPASYRNQFLGADMSGWIRKMRFDSSYQLETISPLTTQASRIIHLEMNPMDECLYYVTYHPHFEVRKICYGGNLPPIAKVNTSVKYGTSPLTVDFDASGSYDPEGGKIDFLWNFGDGDTSSLPAPSHEFTAPDENPFSFTVQLIITDSAGASDTEELIISLNNTPPTVKITSVEDGDHYPVSGSTLLPLEADVSDVESNPGEMNYKWEVFHHHNTHVHPEPADFNSVSEVLLSPEGCNGETFWYHIQLTVTDPHGLKTMDSVNIYPYCDSPYVRIENFQVDSKEQSNLLTWKINEYKPGLSFSVQHSENLSSFRDIGNINMSSGQTQFHFEDFAPVNGLNFYRIKVSGPEKWFDYSPYRLVTFPPKKPIEIFPNPFEDYVKVYFEEVFEGAFMEVFDLQGQLLFRADFDANSSEKTYQVNTGHWISASGVYFFRIYNGGEEFVRKMVKN
ncbi:MAG: T9SS type A sorting domain-containing protein, partial [Bacteroidetes bacterium]|nr:T9SS type A sorting domain-containing protein [Bacteroidota bacterium]